MARLIGSVGLSGLGKQSAKAFNARGKLTPLSAALVAALVLACSGADSATATTSAPAVAGGGGLDWQGVDGRPGVFLPPGGQHGALTTAATGTGGSTATFAAEGAAPPAPRQSCTSALLSVGAPPGTAPGAQVILGVSANCSGPNSEYSFSYAPADNPAQVVPLRDFAASPRFIWDTTSLAPGSYRVVANVRSNDGASAAVDGEAVVLAATPPKAAAAALPGAPNSKSPASGASKAVPNFGSPTVLKSLDAGSPTPTTYPLSADGKYYNVNLLHRNFLPPTANAKFSSGISQLGAAGPSLVFDGRDAAFTAVPSTPGDPNVTVTLMVDMGQYYSVGAIRPLYQPLGGGYPFHQVIRLATKLGPNADWATVVDADVVQADTTLSLTQATAGRYLELTMIGNGGNLLELFVYPGANTSPPPTSANGYDLSSIGANSALNANYWSLGSAWPINWPVGGFRPKSLADGATGDAVATVDLGAEYDVSRLGLGFFWGTPYDKGGRVEIGATLDAFTTIYDSGLGQPFTPWPAYPEFFFPSQSVRYIRTTDYFNPGTGPSAGITWSVQAFQTPPPYVGYYPLSADGKYFVVNLARRPSGNGIQPTATLLSTNGVLPPWNPHAQDAPNVIDGDDDSFVLWNNWVVSPDTTATLRLNLGQVQSIGAIRQVYRYAPLNSSIRVAATLDGDWHQVLQTTPLTTSDVTTSFESVSAQYIELTMTGLTAAGFADLVELQVFPSSATDPAPSSGSHLELTYLTGMTVSVNANMGTSGGAAIHSSEATASYYIKSAAQGATGDATLTLDLGQQYQVSELALSWYASQTWPAGGKVDVDDGSGTWVNVFDSGHGTALGAPADGSQRIAFAPHPARYVRLTGYFDPSAAQGLLENIEVFGTDVSPCSNGVKDAGESDVDCGGSCAACAAGKACNADSDCSADTVCGESNGACFGRARSTRVCWKPDCATDNQATGCGQADSACGQNCDCAIGCDVSNPGSTCPSGESCKAIGKAMFNVTTSGACVASACPSNDPALCGTTSSLCGAECMCTPNCSAATCQNPGDGCGGLCPGVCNGGQTGCVEDVNCPSGDTCIHNDDGTATCRPAACAFAILAPPLCGTAGALCGDQCPACSPACDGRQCGADPNCGQSCGTCSGGQYCSADGQCATPTIDPPITVPDGSGGTKPLPSPSPVTTTPIGAVSGQFSVSEQGTAQYTIPIEVPPGRAGLEPALSLSYSASKVNGTEGLGWHLEGLSKITRCPRTFARDGYAAPIQNDATDVFCIDGKRLEAIVGGYGGNGTQYRTLIDSFSKIVSLVSTDDGPQLSYPAALKVARQLQGPDSFRVYTKDGRILTFGGTQNSLVMGRNGTRYSWLLNRVEDRTGNNILVNYTNVPATTWAPLAQLNPNVVRPESISYTGHGSVAGNRRVAFSYENRSDRQIAFMQGGVPAPAPQRLSLITTFINNTPIKNYRIQYRPEAVSQIEKVYECAGGDDPPTDPTAAASLCKKPTEFHYTETPYGFSPQYGSVDIDLSAAGQLDLNGDGIIDFLRTNRTVDGVDPDVNLMAAETGVDVGIGIVGIAGGPYGEAAAFAYQLVRNDFWGLFGSDPKVEVTRDVRLGTGSRANPLYYVDNAAGMFGDPIKDTFYLMDFDQDGKDDVVIGGDDLSASIFVALSKFNTDGTGSFQRFPAGGMKWTRSSGPKARRRKL